MKHIYKIILSLAVIAFFSSCDNSEGDNEGKFDDNPETGWVQFLFSSFDDDINLETFDTSIPVVLPVAVNVPVNKEDLSIGYSLVSVSGPDPNDFFSNNGVLVAPAGESSFFGNDFAEIELNMEEALDLTWPMVFDVVLESTNRSSISVGIAGSDRPTSIRVSVCPTPLAATTATDISLGYFAGDYTLTVPSGASLFGVNVFDEQVVTLIEGPNGPFSRQFSAPYLPAFSASPETMSFTFVDGEIRIDDTVTTTGCASAIIISENPSQIEAIPCGDEMITLNYYDFTDGSGGCGVSNEPIQLLLTKI